MLRDVKKAGGLGRYETTEFQAAAVPRIGEEVFFDGRTWLVERVQFDPKIPDTVFIYTS
jgi:hypothetical protein